VIRHPGTPTIPGLEHSAVEGPVSLYRTAVESPVTIYRSTVESPVTIYRSTVMLDGADKNREARDLTKRMGRGSSKRPEPPAHESPARVCEAFGCFMMPEVGVEPTRRCREPLLGCALGREKHSVTSRRMVRSSDVLRLVPAATLKALQVSGRSEDQ
jgi:hypothetical protein